MTESRINISSDSSVDFFPSDKVVGSFYTHKNGYKVCLKINLDGVHGKDPHLSKYCDFLKGLIN